MAFNEALMETKMQKFYKNKSIFLTGGSGFLGKALIEKVLRATEVSCIYVLIRPKKDKTIDVRLADILADPLFEQLQQQKPDALKRIQPIAGDCALPDLGISLANRNMLIQCVHIVMHCAASVSFSESLSQAIDINTRATMDLIRLAKNMTKLMAFVHVSSAFANILNKHIDEIYYAQQLSCGAKKMIELKDCLGAELINKMSTILCNEYPNTYTFTKVLAEEAVLTESASLPICIFRPGIVIASYKEPVSGWIDNLYGPTSILYGAAYGVLRVIYARLDANAGVVPVDYCANIMLACAWKTAISVQQKIEPPPIYNLVPNEENALKWIDFKRTVEQYGPKMPLTKMIWLPFLITTNSLFYYKLLCFFYHTMPGYLMDFGLLLIGRKRFMVNTYRKIHQTMDLFSFFIVRDWSFNTKNTKNLWLALTVDDRALFPFDMNQIVWPHYFYNALSGMRRYLAKEEANTIPQAIKLWHRLELLHRTLKLLIYTVGLVLLYLLVKFLLY